tara:strand:- start:347 stop:655 length:309 start_codon:yes stop_codon:yes gene_type:complete
MKITKQRIREIVKETLSKRLNEQEPAAEPATQGNEPRQDIGDLIKKIITDGGDQEQIVQLRKRYEVLDPARKTQVLDAIIKSITGSDVGDKELKQAVLRPDN